MKERIKGDGMGERVTLRIVGPLFSVRFGVAVAALALFVIGIDLVFYPKTLDDAFITFRYAEHLAEGHGFGAWNTNGERVEGYTTMLWMMVLAAGAKLGAGIPTLAKLLGILFHTATCVFLLTFWLILRSQETRTTASGAPPADAVFIATAATALYLPLGWYATTGMETTTFVFLGTLCLISPWMTTGWILPAATAVALVLLRPEGLVFSMGCILFHHIRLALSKRPVRQTAVALVFVVATVTGLTVFRMVQYGEFLPNTYYAKAGGGGLMHLKYGLKYTVDWILVHNLWTVVLLFVAVYTMIRIRRESLRNNLTPLFLLAFVAAYFLYIIKVGGDNYWAFPYWRHMVHLTPFLSLLLGIGLVKVMSDRRRGQIAVLAVIMAAVNVHILVAHGDRMIDDAKLGLATRPVLEHAQTNDYYVWLERVTEPTDVVATFIAGELPYVVDAVHIDLLGLNDRHIAHHGTFDPAGPVDSKSDMGYVLGRRPDMILGYPKAHLILENHPKEDILQHRKKMMLAMLENGIFQEEYLFLQNGPYDHFDWPIYMHRARWERHPQKSKLHCVPVTETALYAD